ncbi:MAG: hypothetical protein ACTHOB_11785 [Ginsengibacter sp.]|jgi:hypothetical protein
MKKLLIFLITFSMFGCQQSSSNTSLQKKVDSLQIAVNNVYKPGLGEFMSEIQVHHAKLWFAGKDENWALANFEIGEIQEALNDIPKYCSDRPEVKSIGMISEPIYNIGNAIKEKDEKKFVDDFTVLTATCNDCHKETNHGFNLIKIPDIPPVSNQVFKPE